MYVIEIFCLILLQVFFVHSFSITDENQLYTDLFTSSGYNSIVRPSETVDVKVEFHLLTINDVNTKSQILTVAGFFTLEWNDGRLVWTAATYAGIDNIFQLESKVWRPEVILDNSVVDLEPLHSSDDQNKLKITNTGDIKWESAGIYDVHCDIDTTFYPFDTQNCYLELTSWAYSITEVNLTNLRTEILMEDFKENGEWIVLKTETAISELHDDGEIRGQLEFIVHIERRATFYVLNVILPVIICSALIPVVFLLPVDSGEKVSYVLTLLLAIAVVLTIIADQLPTTSKTVSVFAIYLAINLGCGGMSILVSVAVLHVYHKEESEEIPKKLRKITTKLFMRFPKHKKIIQARKQAAFSSKTKVVPLSDKDAVSEKEDLKKTDDDIELTWKDISDSMDAFFFRVFTIALSVLCVVFMVTLAVGAHIAAK